MSVNLLYPKGNGKSKNKTKTKPGQKWSKILFLPFPWLKSKTGIGIFNILLEVKLVKETSFSRMYYVK